MQKSLSRKFELMFWDVAIPVLSSARDAKVSASKSWHKVSPIQITKFIIIVGTAAISGFALGTFSYIILH
ncbi:MAG: hypothetical protein HGA53_01235 [Anaerolineaceae bacterium]|nr:hypothetical protein [Anaerolineaceae bacterium]NTV35555.1 hypothetical protein [Anaerolineaceae bacterium]